MTHEYGIIDRDNETPVVWGLRSLEEAQIALKAKQAELDGGWKIVDFTTGQTILTDREYNKGFGDYTKEKYEKPDEFEDWDRLEEKLKQFDDPEPLKQTM